MVQNGSWPITESAASAYHEQRDRFTNTYPSNTKLRIIEIVVHHQRFPGSGCPSVPLPWRQLQRSSYFSPFVLSLFSVYTLSHSLFFSALAFGSRALLNTTRRAESPCHASSCCVKIASSCDPTTANITARWGGPGSRAAEHGASPPPAPPAEEASAPQQLTRMGRPDIPAAPSSARPRAFPQRFLWRFFPLLGHSSTGMQAPRCSTDGGGQ